MAGFNLDDLSQQAKQKLTDCRQEVAKLLADANVEAERICVAARAEGLAAGAEQARRDADQNLQKALQQRMGEHAGAVKSMISQIATQHDQWMKDYANSIVTLATAVAERVVRAKLDREPEILVRWVSDALTTARSAKRISVAVHPETLAELGSDLDQLLRTPGLTEDSVLVPDESVSRTGVVVRQLGGEVDAGLDAQLQILSKLLQESS